MEHSGAAGDSSSPRKKVFGIGLNKTGTTTLGECGRALGYTSTTCDRRLLHTVVRKGDFGAVEEVIAANDLFEDWPWPLIYKECDELVPGSKFILTTRKTPDIWFRSLEKHSMRTWPLYHCRSLAFGVAYPRGNKRELIEFYERHNDEVRSYFANRPGDLLELCWGRGDGWEELCEFLDVPVPDEPFPHANAAGEQSTYPVRRAVNRLLSVIS